MSIYKDLNDLNLDVNAYGEHGLTSLQKKNWERRVLKKIGKPNPKRKYAGIAAAFIVAAGISLSTGMVTVANVPFVGAMIEEFMTAGENADYSPYKTEIGSTAENGYGRWTLNEMMVDSGQLVISSTFEPAAGIEFHYKMHPTPKVIMNGQLLPPGGLQQSIEVNDSMFTIYNSIEIPTIPIGETIQFHITYDNLDSTIDYEGVPVDLPWVFDIRVPTEQLAATSETIHFNLDIPLGNRHTIHLKKMVVSPISTVLYYDWPEEANHIAFKIVSESGTEIEPGSTAISAEGSYNRYIAIDLKSEEYYLVPFEISNNPHAKNPGKVEEQSILINP